mgnify:CR=1 FL=1
MARRGTIPAFKIKRNWMVSRKAFENGLPTTKLETSVPGVEHSWVIGKSRVYGKNVDAISGATISVMSLLDDVEIACKMLREANAPSLTSE